MDADVLRARSDLETAWSLRVAATLRIADRIAAGTTAAPDLARATRVDAGALTRVLRHLTRQGVFAEPEPGQFALNEPATALQEDHPSGLRAELDLNGIGGRMAGAWSTLPEAVRTGRAAYATVFGHPFWDDLAANPDLASSFDDMMGPGHGPPDPDVLLASDWDSVRTLVDVGGGTGMLLAAVLRAHPGLRGTLVDLPRTVARAAAVFAAASVADRATVVGQSFFDPLPPGADLYLLKNTLGDWPDDAAIALLRRCADAARPNGRLVVLGGVSPDEDGVPSPELLMLVLVGGKDRLLAEFRTLAAAAGLAVSAAGKLTSGRYAVECRTA